MSGDAAASSLKFGTSGLRGLVTDLVGGPARDWTRAFLDHLDQGDARGRLLLVGRDLRASSQGIAADCIVAGQGAGWRIADCGAVPTPALALEAMRRDAAAVMVTGSHIPDDRNGLKFYKPAEISKDDEAAIRSAHASPPARPDAAAVGAVDDIGPAVLERYKDRVVVAFGADALSGLTVGVYQQSTVARDLLVETLRALGATPVPLGRADSFIPVDTEAHRPEDVALLRDWARDGRYDALVSTDGDADRPLVADAAGRILRGDVLGLLVARTLGIGAIVTPVTSSAAIEACGIARTVRRTRVGSPFVIAGMAEAAADGATVLGFEANGGCLLGSDVVLPNGVLKALPTRDAFLPIVCALLAARHEPGGLAAAVAALKAGHAMADRLQDIPPEASDAFLRDLATPAYAERFLAPVGTPVATDRLDGVRVQFADGGVIHYRASGNAPELRCYAEAATAERAEALLRWGLTSAAAALSATT